MERLPARGFVTSRADFAAWAEGRGGKRLLMEDFYRDARRRTGVLMEGAEPVGGRWNFDAENREPPPKGATTLGVPEPPWPEEDEIDAEVRRDLDRWEADGDVTFVGRDGPRLFAATRAEALAVLDHFVEHRLPGVRRARGRHPRGRPVDGALADLGADEPRPARPGRGRGAGGGGVRLGRRSPGRASRGSCGR